MARAPPSKLVYNGTKSSRRKFLGSVTKNRNLKIVQRRTLWVGRGPSLRDSTPYRPKGSPFVLFWDIHFWRQYVPVFRGSTRRKKKVFFVQIFQKVPKNAFFGLFFSKLCLRRRNFGQTRNKTLLWESSKNQFGWP